MFNFFHKKDSIMFEALKDLEQPFYPNYLSGLPDFSSVGITIRPSAPNCFHRPNLLSIGQKTSAPNCFYVYQDTSDSRFVVGVTNRRCQVDWEERYLREDEATIVVLGWLIIDRHFFEEARKRGLPYPRTSHLSPVDPCVTFENDIRWMWKTYCIPSKGRLMWV